MSTGVHWQSRSKSAEQPPTAQAEGGIVASAPSGLGCGRSAIRELQQQLELELDHKLQVMADSTNESFLNFEGPNSIDWAGACIYSIIVDISLAKVVQKCGITSLVVQALRPKIPHVYCENT